MTEPEASGQRLPRSCGRDIEDHLRAALASGEPVGPELLAAEELPIVVPAGAIAELIRRPVAEEDQGRSCLFLRNARIEGRLKLQSCILRSRLRLESCVIPDGIELYDSKTESLALIDCQVVDGIDASGVEVRRSFALADCDIQGGLLLNGASVAGSLYLQGSTVATRSEADMHGAISADRVEVHGDMYCQGVRARGAVRLGGARVAGRLVFNGSQLAASRGGENAGKALYADGLSVGGDLFFKEGFVSRGAIGVVQARINGVMSLEGAKLTAPAGGPNEGQALRGDGLCVEGDMFCRDGFTVVGAVRLAGAVVGGELDFSRSRLRAVSHGMEGEAALRAKRIKIARDLLCQDMRCSGRMELMGASIGSRVDFCGAELSDCQIYLESAYAGEVCLLWATAAEKLSLADAQVDVFRDDPDDVPSPAARSIVEPPLDVRGFGFRALVNPGTPASRIRWIRTAEGCLIHQPEIYDVVEREYRRQGRSDEARQVSIAKHRRARDELNWWKKLWSYFFEASVGFGYRLWRAAGWLVAVICIGFVLFSLAGEDSFVPLNSGDEVPGVSPLLYAIDATIPVFDVGHKDLWAPEGLWNIVEVSLAVIGYALAAALIAGGAALFARGQRE